MTTLLLLACLQADPEAMAAEAAAFLKTVEKAAITFYKLDPVSGNAVPPGRRKLREWAVLQQKELTADQADAVRAALADKTTYGKDPAKCFDPGLAFRFTLEGASADAVICLACRHIYVWQDPNLRYTWVISQEGVVRLKKLYDAYADPGAKK